MKNNINKTLSFITLLAGLFMFGFFIALNSDLFDGDVKSVSLDDEEEQTSTFTTDAPPPPEVIQVPEVVIISKKVDAPRQVKDTVPEPYGILEREGALHVDAPEFELREVGLVRPSELKIRNEDGYPDRR